MIHPRTMLYDFGPDLGKGIIATAPIPCGTVTYVRDSLDIVLTPAQWASLPLPLRAAADTYSWVDLDGNRILGWDLSKHVNHSCEANTMATAYGFEIAVRDIAMGEQITAEYGLLGILYEYAVSCGCQHCRGKVSPQDIVLFGEEWDRTIQAALPRLFQVEQPLLGLVTQESLDALRGFLEGKQAYRRMARTP